VLYSFGYAYRKYNPFVGASRLLSKFIKIKIYRITTLPAVLCWCETWSLKLREEQRLRVLENKVPRQILGPKRDEVTHEWRRIHNEELYDLYYYPNIIRVIKSRTMRWAGLLARMGNRRGAYRVLMGKHEGERPLGRSRRRRRIILKWIFKTRMGAWTAGPGSA
jgi:hypothetical protein